MNDNTTQLALAGLLHDIGKFMLWTGASEDSVKGATSGQSDHPNHALLSGSFVAQYTPESWRSVLSGPVGNHHHPQTPEERIVALADLLSVGEQDDEVGKALPARQRLSIFTAVDLDGRTLTAQDEQKAYLPLKPLTMQREAFFPGKPLAANEINESYRKQWEAFQLEAETLRDAHAKSGDLATYLESLLLLMQRYAWSVPAASSKSMLDMSLYDHSRMTGALAAALADLDDDKIQSLLDAPQSDEAVALLLGGDISGVQDFIYTITSRGATSALRGRSFYLQLLTESIARYVLRRLNLPITNLIYQGGGNFYILARASDQTKLPDIQREISRLLLQHHRGELYVALAGESLVASDFFDGRLSDKWHALADQQQSMKLRRFSELAEPELQWLFRPLGDGGNQDKQCQVCGREHPATITVKDVRKCPQCRSYEKLGKDLRKARYLAIEHLPKEATTHEADLTKAPGDYSSVLASFGIKAHLLKTLQDVPETPNSMSLFAIKDSALDDLRPGANLATGRRFLVNVTPERDGEIKTFEDLVEASNGIKRLGVLRMDVDNLGRIFSDGLGQKATLSRVAGLSLAVSLYFDGWVEKIAEERSDDRLYSIYSGGDDLFFVGSWDAVVDFARDVRKDLGAYAANHPAITASAGIALVGGKYPLSQAAADAGLAEGAAKAYRLGSDAKDAISFLGQVQPWSRFGLEEEQGMNSVVGLKLMLEDMQAKGAPRSLIRQLSRLYAQYDAALQERARRGEDATAKGTPQALWGPWMWRGYYLLRRTAKRTKISDIDRLAESLHDDQFRNMSWMGLAARWADLLIRTS